jgi:predicted SnoaL-like aldol condensation-catalyzing enzyme
MPAKDNLGCRWFDDVWNKPDGAAAIDRMAPPDMTAHGADGQTRGLADFKAFHRILNEAMPDLKVTIDRCVEGGDMVAVAWTITGTPRATGEAYETSGLTMMRIADGVLVEGWDDYDFSGLMAALGASPA